MQQQSSTYIIVVCYNYILTITFINQWHCRYYCCISVAPQVAALLVIATIPLSASTMASLVLWDWISVVNNIPIVFRSTIIMSWIIQTPTHISIFNNNNNNKIIRQYQRQLLSYHTINVHLFPQTTTTTRSMTSLNYPRQCNDNKSITTDMTTTSNNNRHLRAFTMAHYSLQLGFHDSPLSITNNYCRRCWCHNHRWEGSPSTNSESATHRKLRVKDHV